MTAVPKTDSYFHYENQLCVAIGGGSVIVWDCSVPGTVAVVEELFGHLPVDRTHEEYLRELAQRVMRDVAQRLGVVTSDGREYWVTHVPVEAGDEWVYHPDREMAKVLTPHHQAEFRAWADAMELNWRLEVP